ncbi:butyryl-CoA dehydrogenase [Prauserella marina]|uniref:Acyl-CoA dehydrogenase n=1 Tax=Prauserella marina TaxID=530584 RepID=A0A222VVD5_9PSEU|nr:acyl-CoA dehydrogenase family protein [Prauserella marina]ASR37850.1 butyryl-CoA dehydrogenase [Prauserella marina]PWV75817.1 alkylation response protein AidB-like acyl-CoA dehydrogenase [Prauserella marina]SDD25410.1 Acyl-CoA dehydrogenase [Prauserella marina]
MGIGLAALTKLAGSKTIERAGLREPVRNLVSAATRNGFRAVGAANRRFTAATRLGKPARLGPAPDAGLFDLTPTEEQQLIAETVTEFAAEQLRPAAAEADTKLAPPDGLLGRATELGVTLVGIPEELGGVGTERSVVTNALVAEALAHGDLGLAVAVLAPSAVSTALVQWGDEDQQATYLPAFVGENVPAAALALQEPVALFDPFRPGLRAKRTPRGYRLDGVKSLVPRAAQAELFIVSADLEGRGPALFIVESGSSGLTCEGEPAMGLRGAATSRLLLDKVELPASALLGEAKPEVFADLVRLSRLGWAALACGTSKAVLDYVIPYVNEREAFGEPVSHRQGVAFQVADIGIELEGMRLVMLRAAARAEQGKPYAREVALARKLAADKGMRIGNAGVQLLGGHGFVKEHPVERWYRDLRAVGVLEGIVLV